MSGSYIVRGVAEHVYSAADLTILSMPEAVRKRPGMYFGIGPGDRRLATRVLCKVVIDAFHPAARVAAGHAPHVVADITADLAFAVTDDQAQLDPSGNAVLGYEKSMLTPERWLYAAAASVSTRTVVEVWQDGRGFRQTLAGLRPVEAPQPSALPPERAHAWPSSLIHTSAARPR